MRGWLRFWLRLNRSHPRAYSAHSMALAADLGEKAAHNLRNAGRQVDIDPHTGRYVVQRRDGKS